MNIEDVRRAGFERRLLSGDMGDGDPDLVVRDNEGEYFSTGVSELWETYNRILDSVVIDIPPALADDMTLIAAIESAGLKVKP